ncbi:MAG: hypothetical protein QMD85_04120 [Candidatus Aenigmarchaeota archaeon]|nr:hypothetical protein [Candidatus Aenigmarchaeota archaeon]MDI6722748.1 hypothetical protein [Candidatus Aenigmarchaeota archaeon]
MAVFPNEPNTGFAGESVYPTWEQMKGGLPTIGVPSNILDVVLEPYDRIRKAWRDLTTHSGPEAKKGTGRPGPVPQELKIYGDCPKEPDISTLYPIKDFYKMMSKVTGAHYKETSYSDIQERVKEYDKKAGREVDKERGVIGLHQAYADGSREVLIAKGNEDGEFDDLMRRTIAYHESGHALGGVSEFDGHARGMLLAKMFGDDAGYKELLEMVNRDPEYFEKN